MFELKENDFIKVVKLLDRPRVCVGPRTPAVGDVATVRIILRNKSGKVSGCLASRVAKNGTLAWMGTLALDELEVIKISDKK